MQRLHRLHLRFYPTLVFVWLNLASRVLALEVSAADKDGASPPEGALTEVYQSLTLSVHDQVAAVHASYHFQNRHEQELELTCNFRLGARELVDSFSYWNGREQILGEVLERQAASAVYEELAGVQRRDPGILEQDGDRFRFRVFPVAPREEKPVELSSIAPLSMREGVIEYVIPKENLPPQGATFAFSADITDSLPIAEVETTGFPAQITRISARHVRVSYEGVATAPSADLALRYRLATSDYAMRMATHRGTDGEGSFMLIVSPKVHVQDADVIGRDLVFVTDISGSMSGLPLEQSKAGLHHMLEQLSDEDRFEVIAFDDESYATFGELTAASAQARTQAKASIDALQTKGGTNIHGALLRALQALEREVSGRPRAIVFLTDGQGDTPPEVVLADVRERAGAVRIYSVGAGEGVNRFFLSRLAEDNRGTATFVSSQSDLGASMKRLYARIAMPLMVDLELDFGGLSVSSVYPKRLPDLYRDGEVVVVGRYLPGAGKITLRGRTQAGAKSFSLDVQLPAAQAEHAYLEKLWASRRIDTLLASLALRGDQPELIQEITRLGIVYDLVTPYTTFLAVPASAQTAELKERMRAGRMGYDKRLVDTLSGITLSQAAIPPGDPVLTVDAPADAREVTAYFPFGLVKALRYDAERGQWYVRFLVPRDVSDGRYTISVRIAHADASVEWRDIAIIIDGTAPELDVRVPEQVVAGELLHVTVDPLEPVRDVHVTLPGLSKARVALKLDPDTGLYEGDVKIPAGASAFTLRVVARDLARNRIRQDLELCVEDFDCGC